MSTIVYNGVTLPYAQLTNFNQEVIYDDSHTDWMCTKFDVSVQCVLNTDYLSTLLPNVAGNPGSPAMLMAYLRTKLLQPRQTLSVTFNGVELIPLQQPRTTTPTDTQNGPQPISCNLQQLTNTTFLLSYRITANYWDRYSWNFGSPWTRTKSTAGNVLSNRWTESVSYDSSMHATLTRRGKMVIRSDNDAGGVADYFRNQLAVVGVPTGFIRQSASYAVAADGLSLTYEITDKEVDTMPPAPAYEAEGEYSETGSRMAAVRIARVNLRLRGSKLTSKPDLAQAAIKVALSKIYNAQQIILQEPKIPFGTIQEIHLGFGLYENRVEARITSMLKQKRAIPAPGLFDTKFHFPFVTPGSTGYVPQPVYNNYGTSNFLLNAASYFDPGVNQALDNLTGQQKQPMGFNPAPGEAFPSIPN